MQYQDTVENITSDQLQGFFVGWPSPPLPETHLRLLRQSAFVVMARDRATHRVIGFITAIADGVLSAYIPLLEVLPDYQGQGIGRQLVHRMLEKLKPYYMVDLFCDADLQPFYEKLGLQRATGIVLRHYENQAGCSMQANDNTMNFNS
ncbi:MAG: GNAT family N-acetyltransferase [Lentisphaeria bacterium]|nr:GNAT family N-acetyltransferase [Candidatus Neomarinimicrobiota bacterium]MCF7843144.1 GNAT family N-acetyltransferase [Lentisphaeria bacterium]